MADRQLQAAKQEVRLPFFDQADFRGFSNRGGGGALGADNILINAYPSIHRNTSTGEGEAVVIKRPGIASASISLTLNSQTQCMPKAHACITALTDVNVAAVYDASNTTIYVYQYRPTAGTTTLIGSLSSAHVNDEVYITEIQTTTLELPAIALTWIRNAGTTQMWYAQSASGVFTAASLTQVTSLSFPPNQTPALQLVGPAQQLNGYIYVMTSRGDIYQSSNVFDIVNWGSSKFVQTYMYSDNGIGIVRYKHHLVAFSTNSIEFFNDDQPDPPAPSLTRTQQAFIKFGAVSAKAIRNVDDVLYWVAASDSTTTGVWKLDGYTPVKISTPRYDLAIASAYLAGTRQISMESIVMGGSKNLLINCIGTYANLVYTSFTPAAADTSFNINTLDSRPSIIAYNLDAQAWWSISDAHVAGNTFWLPTAYFKDAGTGKFMQYVLKGKDAVGAFPNVYVLDGAATYVGFDDVDATAIKTSVDTAVPVIIQLNPVEFGTERNKRIDRIKVIGDFMLRAGGDTSTPYMYILMTRVDVPNAAGDIITRSFTIPTASPFRYHINNCGMFRRFSACIAFKNKMAWRGKALEVAVAQATA